MKQKFLPIIALLLIAVSGAWADSFSADAYAANATLNGVSVSTDQTVTINEGVTVTVNNGLSIQSNATLTVTGGGTLVVNGATGANGQDEQETVDPLTGELVMVKATPGGNGYSGIVIDNDGNLIISNATIIAVGGKGGQGGKIEDESFAANGADGNGFASFPAIDGAVMSYSTNGTDYTEYASGDKTLYRYMKAVKVAPPTYSVTLAEGTEDAENWKVKVGEGEAQAFPVEGLNGGETVTVTYNGSKKVKSVTAVKVAPSVIEVTTFSELQTALSTGKDVKLMNDIVCTAVIEINSDGALTIDGNGKKLSPTSAIRAFTVKSSATVAFKNLTLTGFVNGGGPAINNSGTIVLDGCTISNCHVNISGTGGGAIESRGKLYAINTTFSGNYSGEIGGAINNNNGSLYMIGCTFTNNYTTKGDAYYGGAIGINRGSEVRLINCSFSGNKYDTTTGLSDIGVYYKPTNYTIAGCTGVTIASDDGDITTIASGTATLDYSDLSNISFTYTAE